MTALGKTSQTPTVVISIILLIVLLYWIAFRGPMRLREILWISLATVICNAAICGALSGADDRYESRVIWLLPLLAYLASVSGIDAWKRSRCSAAEVDPS